ncbi:MAG: peroxidase-related enzyme [Gemmataceae bacterium]|nr:peroxidase-related enzyme [Gemmataceae bacterium]
MPHITLPPGAPGIIGPMLAYPETEKHLNGLAEALLRGPSSLTPAERELIATHVSNRNRCHFCTSSHAAAARHLYGPDARVVDDVLADPAAAPVTPKMAALLEIAGKVQGGGRSVSDADVARARREGADDKAIHDTVLIAAAFCMFNRYVDGLATWAPQEPAAYVPMGAKLATQGYLNAIR